MEIYHNLSIMRFTRFQFRWRRRRRSEEHSNDAAIVGENDGDAEFDIDDVIDVDCITSSSRSRNFKPNLSRITSHNSSGQ